jgi:hypothetical protein
VGALIGGRYETSLTMLRSSAINCHVGVTLWRDLRVQLDVSSIWVFMLFGLGQHGEHEL